MMAKTIECKSEIGTTVGLIDAVITLTRLLDARLEYDAMIIGRRGDKYQPIRDALNDLLNNSPYRKIITSRDDDAMRIIHDAASLLTSSRGAAQAEQQSDAGPSRRLPGQRPGPRGALPSQERGK